MEAFNILGNLAVGFTDIVNFECMLMIAFGTFLGIVVGALPGLTATTGVSIFLPMTFFMAPVPGIGFLLGIYCGGMYGGSITSILINTPGTPAGAATALDGFPLARKGRALEALQIALYASVVGGLLSAFILIGISPLLAKVALSFGPPQYFALGVFGMTIVASLSSGNITKGLIAACVGMCFSFIGLDPINASLRLTFGFVALQNGLTLIPTLIGLFAMSELYIQAEAVFKKVDEEKVVVRGQNISFKTFMSCFKDIVKGSLIGAFIGAVPATGGAVAAFTSYNEARRSSRNPEEFGHGALAGVAAAESGNNGVTGATLIPLLTLGIPGDSVTAVLLGALMVQGLTPGPLLFETDARTIFGLYAALIVANIFMLIMGAIGIKGFHRVTDIPKHILQPIIYGLCFIGTYASTTRPYELYCMLLVALVGYLFVKVRIPVAPALLSLILGPLVEANLRRGLQQSRGDYWIFVSQPSTLIILGLSLFSLLWCLVREFRHFYKADYVVKDDATND